MKIAILTSKNQWFLPYALALQKQIDNCVIFKDHTMISDSFDIIFILGYHKIIEKEYLALHKHNIVIHESDLPEGKGWAPLFWQILEGKNTIVFTMFEAGQGIDDGEVYIRRTLHLTGDELNDELRKKQAELTMSMCLEFINNYDTFKTSSPQNGIESFYTKRTPKDSQLDTNKSIEEQFNLLRIVDNNEYPAFFYMNGYKYILKIEKEDL